MISFKDRHHQQDIILQCVRWYLAYSLSYRDLEELMQERSSKGSVVPTFREQKTSANFDI